MQSLFIDVRSYMDDPSVVHSFVERQEDRLRYYVFSFIDVASGLGRTRETLWIDRRNLEVTRKEIFDADGALEMRVEYGSHQDVAGVRFPFRVLVERPLEGATLQIDFLEPRFNVEIDDEAFVLTVPRGFQEIRLGNGQPVATTEPNVRN
jgi:outer membrane lipoprotein-sorting protein